MPWPASGPVRKPAPQALPSPATPEAAVKNIFSDNTILYFLMEYSVFMYMEISWGNWHGYCLRHFSFLCVEEIQKALSWLS